MGFADKLAEDRVLPVAYSSQPLRSCILIGVARNIDYSTVYEAKIARPNLARPLSAVCCVMLNLKTLSTVLEIRRALSVLKSLFQSDSF